MDITRSQMRTLRKAQQGEVDAAFMYRRLARKVPEIADKLAFKRLAGDEERHGEVFFKYTRRKLIPNPAKAIFVPLLYRLLGRKKVYPIIADAEYKAAKKYSHIIDQFPEVETVMKDETFHGDAVMKLLEN